MTSKITKELVENNYAIVSGLAKGVDSQAHNTCLDNNGYTIAVVGNGIEYKYPSSNSSLYDKIVEHGGLIISEYPDNVEPSPSNFPLRNRIIAGLGEFLIVTEAYDRSGTLITVKNALYQGKDVYCVPYRADSNSICNLLIKQGATLIETADDILEKI